jgi:elongator complex protein 1
MALYELTVESAAVDVAFGRKNESFAILHRKGVDVYDWPTKDGRSLKPQLKVKVPFGPANIPEDNVGLRICCSSEGRFKLMSYQDDLGNLQLSVKADAEDAHLDFLNEDQLFVSTTTYEDDTSIEGYGQDRTGKIHRLMSTGSELLPVQFQTQLPWFEVAKVNDSIIAFGLSRGGHLFANSRLLAKNCTSFAVTPDHLIFTTNNHLIKYVHLAVDVEGWYFPKLNWIGRMLLTT